VKGLLSVSIAVLGAVGAVGALARFSAAQDAPQGKGDVQLIPRDVLFGNPERAQVRISPGGKHLSFLAPVNGVLNVWVAPTNDLSAAKAVTNDAKRGIMQYQWAFDDAHILYLQDEGVLSEFYKQFRGAVGEDPTGAKTLADVLGVDDLAAFEPGWRKWVLALKR
jgi:hypothetical protein